MSTPSVRAGNPPLVRLSSYVLFIDYGAEVDVQHALRASRHRIDRSTYDDLIRFRGFRTADERHASWIETGVLVPPYGDEPEHHGGFRPGTEAQLGRDFQQWYWQHEIESEREYRWLGQNIVKMPSDLFFYQEVLAARRIDSVLEIGYGAAGGLWFFASVLGMLGGGLVVGVDRERPQQIPAFDRFAGVGVELLHGDAHDPALLDAVLAKRPMGYGLVVIDADSRPEGKIALLERWSAAVSAGGYLALEDVSSPECIEADQVIASGVDSFLLENVAFGIAVEAARFPLLKARGAVFQHLG